MKEFYVRKGEDIEQFVKAFMSEHPGYDRVEQTEKNGAVLVQFYEAQAAKVVPETRQDTNNNDVIFEKEKPMTEQKDSSIGEVLGLFVDTRIDAKSAAIEKRIQEKADAADAKIKVVSDQAAQASHAIQNTVAAGVQSMTAIVEKTDAENKKMREEIRAEVKAEIAAIRKEVQAEAASRKRTVAYLKGTPE